jgi:hypothetical protein
MILYLTLYRRFFLAIARGVKKIEYRRGKYWTQRLQGKKYTQVFFRNGYTRSAPSILCDIKKIEYRGDDEFHIHLGKIIQIKNLQHIPSS